jgi:hypothetical protein
VLFLKKLTLDFDARTKHLAITPVLVRLPGLPLILWFKKVFKEITNSLGFFYEDDSSYKTTGYMGMAQILVGINISGSLVDSITIQPGKNYYHQSLDYEGIPFRYGKHHSYGNLYKDCIRSR